MKRLYRIEDDLHAEPREEEFESFEAALAEVRRLAAIPWGEPPNVAPCQNSQNCGRQYVIVESDISTTPFWTELDRTPIVEIMRNDLKWLYAEGGA